MRCELKAEERPGIEERKLYDEVPPEDLDIEFRLK